MTLDEAIAELRELNEEVPKPMRLPTAAEVATAEVRLKRKFHADLRKYLLEASDVVVGAMEPVTIAPPTGHTDMVRVCEDAWEHMELPRELLPICEDNGDYYCMNEAGAVVFWSHNDGDVTEEWADLATWIEEVWIGEAEDEG